MAHQDAGTLRRLSEDRPAIAVLLVDDQRFVGAAVARSLASEADIALHCCYQAREAIDQANQIDPTVILQDLLLPDIDGLTLVRLFRANPATATTPIIVLSANDDAATRALARIAGANDFLVKLPAKEDFIACIRRHAFTDAIAPGQPTASSPGAAGWARERTETLDSRVLDTLRESMADGDPDLMSNLMDLFSSEAAAQVDVMREASRRLDAATMKATAHSLKGSSLTMVAGRLAALCAELETHVTANPQTTVHSALMLEVERELVRVQRALTETQVSIQQ
jgi:PleD family two-component response regulator